MQTVSRTINGLNDLIALLSGARKGDVMNTGRARLVFITRAGGNNQQDLLFADYDDGERWSLSPRRVAEILHGREVETEFGAGAAVLPDPKLVAIRTTNDRKKAILKLQKANMEARVGLDKRKKPYRTLVAEYAALDAELLSLES